jgi:uncharacterized membrane protein
MNEQLTAERQLKEQLTIAHVIYGMYAASLLVGITAIVGIVLNYIKRDDVVGTWLESHFRWQIRTFWWALLWGIIGALTAIILIGFAILFADFVWFVYRIAKGWLRLNEGKPMYVTPPPPATPAA